LQKVFNLASAGQGSKKKPKDKHLFCVLKENMFKTARHAAPFIWRVVLSKPYHRAHRENM
jgi:hypothetical protein